MKNLIYLIVSVILLMIAACSRPITNLKLENPDCKVLFLHHSTGNNVWYGDIEPNKRFYLRKSTCMVPKIIKEYNEQHGTKISVEEYYFPSGNPYPWENDPFNYYDIWVKNAGESPYMKEPTLEMLTKKFNIISFKHCFPVSSIEEDDMNPDINSKKRTLANYKLQYNALRDKLYKYPQTKFIVWTGSALSEASSNEEEAKRAKEFASWVKSEWDKNDDNIFIFDFREIETEGGLYLKPEYAAGTNDSHPNKVLSQIAARLFANKIIEVYSQK
jgi:hypothetical protein